MYNLCSFRFCSITFFHAVFVLLVNQVCLEFKVGMSVLMIVTVICAMQVSYDKSLSVMVACYVCFSASPLGMRCSLSLVISIFTSSPKLPNKGSVASFNPNTLPSFDRIALPNFLGSGSGGESIMVAEYKRFKLSRRLNQIERENRDNRVLLKLKFILFFNIFFLNWLFLIYLNSKLTIKNRTTFIFNTIKI